MAFLKTVLKNTKHIFYCYGLLSESTKTPTDGLTNEARFFRLY